MPDPQQPRVRFTPQEIKALMANGELTPDLLHKMHPDDVNVAQALFNNGDYHVDRQGNEISQSEAAMNNIKAHPWAGVPLALGAAVPLGVGGAVTGAGLAGTAAAAGRGALDVGKYYALFKALDMAGAPSEAKTAAMFALGLRGGNHGGGGKGATVAAEEATAIPSEEAAIRKQLAAKGLPPSLIDEVVRRDQAGASSLSAGPPQTPQGLGFARPSAAPPPILSTAPTQGPSVDDAVARILGTGPGAGMSASTDPQLVKELVTGASHMPGQGPTPVYWNDPALRSSVEKLKRQVKRRNPDD